MSPRHPLAVLNLAALLVLNGSVARAAESPRPIPGFVEVRADAVPRKRVADRWEPIGEAPANGFVVVWGERLPAWIAGEPTVHAPVAVTAAIVVASSRPLRMDGRWTWDDGESSAGEITALPRAPRWFEPPWPTPFPHTTYALFRGRRHFRSAGEHEVHLTVALTAEDGTRMSVRTARTVAVRDPGLSLQPWELTLGAFTLVAPKGTACSPAPLDGSMEASIPFVSGSAFDVGYDAAWDWGDGTRTTGLVTEAGGRGVVAGSHTYAAGGRWPVEVTLTGKRRRGAPKSVSRTIEFSTADFALDDLVVSAEPVPVGEDVAFQATYRAATPGRTLGSYWQWGDGTPDEDGVIAESGGFGTVTGRHVYRGAGRYPVLVSVGDEVCSQTSVAEIVVTAPARVAAGGAIVSLPGVYRARPAIGGSAAIQVDARFTQDGATGTVTFSFAAAGLEFESRRLTTVAARPGRADIAGSGVVNGRDGYSFTLSLWTTPAEGTAPVHTWARMKIHDDAAAQNLYDNEAFDGALQPLAGARFEVEGDRAP